MAFIVDSGFRVTSALPADLKSIWASTSSLYPSITINPSGYISSSWRYVGMTVYCQDNSSEYKLIGGVTDNDWVKITSGSYYLSASYVSGSTTSDTASYALYAELAGSSSISLTSIFSDTASIAIESTFSDTASIAFLAYDSLNSIQSVFSTQSIYASSSLIAVSSSWASSSISSSYSTTASLSYNSLTASHLLGDAELSGSIIADLSQSAPPWREGSLFWDKNNHTYAIYNDQSEVTLQIGQETLIKVIAGEYIPNGCPVYISNSLNTYPIAKLGLADGTRNVKYQIVGISTQVIVSGSEGYITIQGRVNDVDTSAFPAGTGLFLSYINSGSYIAYPPPQPYERVVCGYVLHQDAINGKILVDIVALPEAQNTYVGMTDVPTISSSSVSPSGSIINIGVGHVNLCTSADGTGIIKNYPLSPASFSVTSSFIDSQYIIASYNSGNPQYEIITDRTIINSVQTTLVYTVLNGAQGRFVYSSWDEPGILLANKDYSRVQALRGIEREIGCNLSTSASVNSGYITITEGYAWQGVNRQHLSAINSYTDRTILVANSASTWSGSIMSEIIWDKCDNGTNIVPLSNNKYVVNWIYRTNVNLNSTLVQLGPEYATLPDAISSQPPISPPEMKDYSFLTGRIIIQNVADPTLRIIRVDSAYLKTFVPAGITNHNLLDGLQGGNSVASQYYHLNAFEYAYGTGSIIRQTGSFISGSITNAITASYAIHASNSLYSNESVFSTQSIYASSSLIAISASWTSASISSSHSDTASYVDFTPITSLSASWASESIQSCYSTQSIYASSSLVAISSSWASGSISASFATQTLTSDFALLAGSAISSSYAITASYSFTSFVTQSVYASSSLISISSSWASSSISSSHSDTASYINFTPDTSVTSSWASQSLSASYTDTASVSVNALTASYLIYPANIVNTTNNSTTTFISVLNSVYNSVFMSYVLTNHQNFRAGNIVVIYTTSSVFLSETTTADIGNSSGVQISSSLSESYMNLQLINNTDNDYIIKYHYYVL